MPNRLGCPPRGRGGVKGLFGLSALIRFDPSLNGFRANGFENLGFRRNGVCGALMSWRTGGIVPVDEADVSLWWVCIGSRLDRIHLGSVPRNFEI